MAILFVGICVLSRRISTTGIAIATLLEKMFFDLSCACVRFAVFVYPGVAFFLNTRLLCYKWIQPRSLRSSARVDKKGSVSQAQGLAFFDEEYFILKTIAQDGLFVKNFLYMI